MVFMSVLYEICCGRTGYEHPLQSTVKPMQWGYGYCKQPLT